MQNDLGSESLEQAASWKGRWAGVACEQGPELRVLWGMDREVETRMRETVRGGKKEEEGREGEMDGEEEWTGLVID